MIIHLKILYFILFAAFFSILIFARAPENKPDKIGFLTNGKSSTESDAAFRFLSENQYDAVKMSISEVVKNPDILNQLKVVWYHRPDSSDLSDEENNPDFIKIINRFVLHGGGLLLSLDAVRLAVPIGLEREDPGVEYAQAIDEGYGRKLGLHSLRTHPVFEGLNGGAYIWAPLKDGVVRQVGYFGSNVPQGKVVAVDWAYITLKESSKLMLEYSPGKGKVLSIGTYTYFVPGNQNRLQFELFMRNCLNYLAGVKNGVKIRYWNYKPPTVTEFQQTSSKIKIDSAMGWKDNNDSLIISSRLASDNEWDTGGERILLMGRETGGITEIWTHPFMALRDYDVGVRFSYRDTIYWFNDQRPQIEVRPGSFTRIYKFPRAYITEVITSDRHNPSGIIHYEYRGVYSAELIVKFKSNLRFMWPYSHKALGSLYYTWDDGLNAFVIKNESNEFYTIVGQTKIPVYKLSGQFDGFSADGKMFKGIPTDKLQSAFLLKFDMKMNDNLDLIVAGTDEGFDAAALYFEKAISSPQTVYENTAKYYNDFLTSSLIITTPDKNFNDGYRWALTGTDRFFVNTPGIGKSLVAGYSTTAHGWGGNQDVSGRPGYAWYFGRDGEWSGMAVLDYGDASKIRDVLDTYQKFQDVNGKIFHELTTSGVVHYDAADATPLYIILAGKYLKWTGDINYIRNSWPYIKKAIDFLYSTDTDGDHLIENTNVGHGWVEGGELFGSKTTFYLAGCWAETLKEAQYIAEALKHADEAEKYRSDYEIVQKIVNNDFWNSDEKFYNYGLLPDNTYNTQMTALPAVPMYFGLVDNERAYPVLDAYSGNGFTADWGVRIISESNPMFNPRGYHYGSIWPLFTGWTSLAEYTYGNYLQGFNHLLDNLNVYKNWGLGFVEEVLNGEQYLPSGVCPHQCWSETMVLQPVLEGMLGLKPDALNHKLTLSPRLPADWDFIKVENIKCGDHTLNFRMTRTSDKIVFFFRHTGNKKLDIDFRPFLPPGTMISKVLVDGELINLQKMTGRQQDYINLSISVNNNSEVDVFYKNGICALPVKTNPRVGEYSEGFRILSAGLNGNVYQVKVQGRSGNEEILKVFAPGDNIDSVDNGTLDGFHNNVYDIRVVFEKSDHKYIEKEIKVNLK